MSGPEFGNNPRLDKPAGSFRVELIGDEPHIQYAVNADPQTDISTDFLSAIEKLTPGGPPLTFGRSKSSDFQIPAEFSYVSSNHGSIRLSSDFRYEVANTSSNGTFAGGKLLQRFDSLVCLPGTQVFLPGTPIAIVLPDLNPSSQAKRRVRRKEKLITGLKQALELHEELDQEAATQFAANIESSGFISESLSTRRICKRIRNLASNPAKIRAIVGPISESKIRKFSQDVLTLSRNLDNEVRSANRTPGKEFSFSGRLLEYALEFFERDCFSQDDESASCISVKSSSQISLGSTSTSPSSLNTGSLFHLGKNPDENIEALKLAGLNPKHIVKDGGVKYSFTDAFRMKGDRLGVFAIVSHRDHKVLRLFYTSSSQGLFRLLPARNRGLLNVPGFDKAGDENMLAPSAEVQKAFFKISDRMLFEGSVLEVETQDYEGGVRVNRSSNEYLEYLDDTLMFPAKKKIARRRLLASRRQNDGEDYYGNNCRSPEKVRILDRGDKPNFAAEVDSFSGGGAEFFVYHSNNQELEYLVRKELSGKISIAQVTDLTASISDFGLPERVVDAGELVMPLHEYPQQIPMGYAGPQHPIKRRYLSTWNYLRGMEEIQRWYQESDAGKELGGIPGPEITPKYRR